LSVRRSWCCIGGWTLGADALDVIARAGDQLRRRRSSSRPTSGLHHITDRAWAALGRSLIATVGLLRWLAAGRGGAVVRHRALASDTGRSRGQLNKGAPRRAHGRDGFLADRVCHRVLWTTSKLAAMGPNQNSWPIGLTSDCHHARNARQDIKTNGVGCHLARGPGTAILLAGNSSLRRSWCACRRS